MSVEGLRAWIGEVERKLAKRTRVFLALTVIAIGIAGASVYLAIDARNDSVSEGDVQELQRELEVQIDEAGAGTGAAVPPVAPEVEPPSGPGNEEPAPGTGSNQGGNAEDGSSAGGDTGGVAPGGASAGDGAGPSKGSPDRAKLKELLEQADEQDAQAEADQAGK